MNDQSYQRYWWLHELTRLRALQRVHGVETRKERKAAQRELVKLRENRDVQKTSKGKGR
jgi:hypothetical protein